MSLTTIPVSKEVRDQLRQLASQGETHDDLLRRLMEGAEARYLYERESASSKPRRSSLLTERRILLSETATHQLERAPGMPTGGSESGSIPSMTTGGHHEVHLGRDMMESIP